MARIKSVIKPAVKIRYTSLCHSKNIGQCGIYDSVSSEDAIFFNDLRCGELSLWGNSPRQYCLSFRTDSY